MSATKIKKLLKAKGIIPERVEYMRSCPTPSGYAKGWDIDFTEEDVNKVFARGYSGINRYMEFGDLAEVLDYIEWLPTLGGEVI